MLFLMSAAVDDAQVVVTRNAGAIVDAAPSHRPIQVTSSGANTWRQREHASSPTL